MSTKSTGGGAVSATTSINAAGQKFGLAALSLGGILALAFGHPHLLVLPLLSGFLVSVGFILATIAFARHRGWLGDAGTRSLEDRMILPGMLVFGGFAAGIFADADEVLQVLTLLR